MRTHSLLRNDDLSTEKLLLRRLDTSLRFPPARVALRPASPGRRGNLKSLGSRRFFLRWRRSVSVRELDGAVDNRVDEEDVAKGDAEDERLNADVDVGDLTASVGATVHREGDVKVVEDADVLLRLIHLRFGEG